LKNYQDGDWITLTGLTPTQFWCLSKGRSECPRSYVVAFLCLAYWFTTNQN